MRRDFVIIRLSGVNTPVRVASWFIRPQPGVLVASFMRQEMMMAVSMSHSDVSCKIVFAKIQESIMLFLKTNVVSHLLTCDVDGTCVPSQCLFSYTS